MTANPALVGPQADLKTFVVPASIIDMQTPVFDDPESIETLLFQTGFSFKRLPFPGFRNLTSMQSICIPASVEVIDSGCFVASDISTKSSPLKNVTFETGSKLRQIAPFAFRGCYSLESLSLPVSIASIEPGAFCCSGICSLQIESGNPRYCIFGCFLMNFDGIQLVHNFSRDSTVKVPDKIEILRERCFYQCNELRKVEFSRASHLLSIAACVFDACRELQSFCVPASVTEIGQRAFEFCTALCELKFERGSKLVMIDSMAFVACSSLRIIPIPSSVETINGGCLSYCQALKAVDFLADSHLVRLGDTVFRECSVLSSLTIPVSVEYIGEQCFLDCRALKTLWFAAPSRVRALLDVPACWSGFITMPDSVEHICIWKLLRESKCILDFSANSRLESIDPLPRTKRLDCLLRISALGLKRIRARLEFPTKQAK
jgi:hypothetical protein